MDPSTEKEQLAERVKVLESQLQEQTSKSTQLQSSLDASHDRTSEVTQRLEAANASLAATKQDLARCAAELATEKAHSEHFLQDIQAVKQQSAVLRQQLDDAQASVLILWASAFWRSQTCSAQAMEKYIAVK